MLEFIESYLKKRREQKEALDHDSGYGYACTHLLHYKLPESDIPDCVLHPTGFDKGINNAIRDVHQLKPGNTLPKPIDYELAIGEVYWLVTPTSKSFVVKTQWQNEYFDKMWLDRGLIHLTQASALEHVRIILNIGTGTLNELKDYK